MAALIYSAVRALRSLFAPGMFSLMIVCVIVTVATLMGFVALVTFICHMVAPQLPAVSWLGGLGATVIAHILFPGIMPVIASFFDNRIVTLVEREDYPGSVTLPPKFVPELMHDIRFAIAIIFFNILVMPLYFFPVLIPFVFYLLNGYLLGREFFVMVGRRHTPVHLAEAFRKQHSRVVTLAGIGFAITATIPLVNLLAPFWGIAVMTHLYHRLAGQPIEKIH